MRQGQAHTPESIEAIRAGVRARWQAKRERDSLVVYSIDHALELFEEADHRIAKLRRLKFYVPGSLEYDEYMAAERAAEAAVHALTVAAGVVREATNQEKS